MQLYLLRHGIAEDPQPGQPDEDRALTKEGKEKLRHVLKVAREAGLSPDVIVSSPFRRARETAEIARHVLDRKDDLVFADALTPDIAAEEAWQELRAYHASEQVLAVSHNPLVSHLVGYLCGSHALRVDVKKGALVRVDFTQVTPIPRGVLVSLLTPRLAGA